MGQVHLYFIYGLAFFAMGTAVLTFVHGAHSLPGLRDLKWIGFFGLLHGVNEWLVMFSFLEVSRDGLQSGVVLRELVNAASYVVLTIGAVRLLRGRGWWLAGLFLILLWVLSLLALWFAGAPAPEFDVVTRLMLGSPAAFLAVAAFLRLQPDPAGHGSYLKRQKVAFRLVAAAFGVYGLFTLVAQPSDLFPATHVNTLWFAELTGIEVPWFRASAACAIAIGLLFVVRLISDERIDSLQEREERLLSVLDNSPMGVSIFSTAPFVRHYANRPFAELVGHKRDTGQEVAGRETFVNPEDYQRMADDLAQGVERDNVIAQRVRPDTGELWWSSVSTRNIDFAGRDAALVWVHDISGAKSREEQLAQSAVQLRAILESCTTAVCVFHRVSEDREYLYASNRMLEMFGAKDVGELNAFGFINTFADQNEGAKMRDRHNQGQYRQDAIYERVRLDGSRFWIMGTASEIEFEGQPATIAWITDISDRVDAENRTAQHANQLRDMLETSEAGVSVFRRGTLERVYANQGFLRRFGLASHEELNGMDLRATFVNPADADWVIEHLQTGAGQQRFEMERRRVDGSKWWAQVETKPIEFDGEMATIVWHYDITEQKRAQEELEAGARRFREILESSEAGISIFDVDTFDRRYVNSVFLRMFGAETIDEINAVDFRDTFESHAIAEAVTTQLRDGDLMGRRSEMRRRIDGSTWWAVIDAKRIEFDGKPAVITWHYDISEQKEVENELRKTVDVLRQTQEELVEAEKMASLGGLVAGVAHEINTPIGICLTSASAMTGKIDELKAAVESGQLTRGKFISRLETIDGAADLVVRNAKRAGELISSFKQVAVDQTSGERRNFALIDYIEEVLVSLGPELTRRNITNELKGDRELELSGYPGAIGQIVTNLAMNAAIHAYDDGAGGKTEIICNQENSGEIVMTFRDFGKGMEEETARRIFEPFFTTRQGRGGTGLGMHILYNLVTQRLGGRVACRSKPGEGTTIELRFPRVAI
ncbi:PAS domain-containing sensor histidine kinase [Nisaea sp.]|uniref:PAS domain-containing sensor histidine kinase n=1 Tax=Nisaea sp. TaxID=2024842 RepID=UPI002B276B62|nr:PAS domain-containing sensor histidine kinase [Nisaea sp.]